FYDGVFFVHTSLKSLADTTVSSAFFALSGAKNLLGQKRDLIMSKHLLKLRRNTGLQNHKERNQPAHRNNRGN
ncbi:MAG: hypothetical protein KI786_08630, partial [Mameliella sp.]|nr:hypothetical protein [Phaeodactylibacter sp.]